MASIDGDVISKYFHPGAHVEISNEEEGFRGSWYAGIVIRSAKKLTPTQKSSPSSSSSSSRNSRKMSSAVKVLVEYRTLMEDAAGTRPLREELEPRQLRPAPPNENLQNFKFSDEVDAYYNDGWWEGVIAEVSGDDKYRVFFRGSREQRFFKASQLRLHREWVYGKWVPPLEPGHEDPPLNPQTNKEGAVSTEEMPDKVIFDDSISPGAQVEVISDEDGFQGAWFPATLVRRLDEGKYLVEHQSLRNDDNTEFLREEVDNLHVRPCPPEYISIDRFEVLDEVDAWYNDIWWTGTISKVLKEDRYYVYFGSTDEELKFRDSNLRIHQDWIDGKWVVVSKSAKSKSKP